MRCQNFALNKQIHRSIFSSIVHMGIIAQAIDKFASARHPGIYKQNYIDALYMFYHEQRPEYVVCPRTPEWKNISDLDTSEAMQDQTTYGDAPLHENHVKNDVLTNDDVLGDAIPPDQLPSMRQLCYELLKLGVGARGNSQFPGSHPVSLNREKLQLLRQRYYYATWKADGTRYMMLITGDGCYLIDRKFYFHRVPMRFPCKYENKDVPEKMHHYTLLDGEMIIDTDPITRKQQRRYLIYDLMTVNKKTITELPFYERWRSLELEVINPRNKERQSIFKSDNPYYRYDLEPFSVRRKNFWSLNTVPKLLNNLIPHLSHESDGLIFQGWDDPYVAHTHEGLLKWKFPEMNSVDFLFEFGVDNCELLFLHHRGRKKLMKGDRVFFKDPSDHSQFAGKIIECSWDLEQESWVYMRTRIDKSTPNEFNIYKKVMQSIKDNITQEVLLKEIDEIVHLPIYADRMQNDVNAHQHTASAQERTSSSSTSKSCQDQLDLKYKGRSCDCGRQTLIKIVDSDGPNKGKLYFVCPDGSCRCRFICWCMPYSTEVMRSNNASNDGAVYGEITSERPSSNLMIQVLKRRQFLKMMIVGGFFIYLVRLYYT